VGQYLFVYGTLRPALAPPGLRPHLEGWRNCGPARIPGRLYDLGRYPGAVLDPAESRSVCGEVFEVPGGEEALAALDDYEEVVAGRPEVSLYLRVLREVRLATGAEVPCWVYVFNGDVSAAPLIESGDYLRR
jgi:gamma-glutamylcyclotransferase (GGCT)/AIG2-like uncharacterized protein YtfP